MPRTDGKRIGSTDKRRRPNGIRGAWAAVALVVSVALVLVTAASGASAASAQARPKAPSSVVILVAGFGSSVAASTYNPLVQSSAALTDIETAFDPDPTKEPAGCNASPNMTTALGQAGALILPFSYNGVTVGGTVARPKVTVTSYASNVPSTTLPQVAAPRLAREVDQAHKLWPSARIVVAGHSEGGYVAEEYFRTSFNHGHDPEVTGIFSLDSPINGIRNEAEVATLLHAIKYPVSTALLDQFQSAWNHAGANSAALLKKEGKSATYVPVGTRGDNVYRIADDPVAGLTSQVLVGKSGQPLASKKSPNFIDPAAPPVAGLSDPAGVVASHQCVMGNSQVIQAVVHRVRAAAKG
jgi:hypothetical protein